MQNHDSPGNTGQNRIRLATSIPSLKDKIQIDLAPDSDDVFWYIRFNIPLDESSVSHKTMSVTDTAGYIMRTEISYNQASNMIVISPIDSYEQDIYYLLNISKKVRSAKGQHLRSKIHILFKLIGNQISEFKVLKSTVKVPLPRPRPKDYEQKVSRMKLYSFGDALLKDVPQDKLPTTPISANLLPAVLGPLVIAANFFVKMPVLWLVGVGLCLLGAIWLGFALSRPKQRSVIFYNRGVRHFNKERYTKAHQCFKQALALDENNELAEFAYNKVSFYL